MSCICHEEINYKNLNIHYSSNIHTNYMIIYNIFETYYKQNKFVYMKLFDFIKNNVGNNIVDISSLDMYTIFSVPNCFIDEYLSTIYLVRLFLSDILFLR